MAFSVTRAAWAVVMLAVALCFATCGTAIPTPSYSMTAGVSGVSYFWSVVQTMMADSATVDTQVLTAIQQDLQTAVGTDATIASATIMVNASAMYINYGAVVVGSSPTEAEVSALVAKCTFPQLTSVMDSLKSSTDLSAVSDLIPTTLVVTTPLYYDPNAVDSTTVTYVNNVQYDVVVMFSGEPSAWTTVLQSDSTTVSENIVSAVKALLDSSKEENDVTVTEMYVLAADTKKKSMGSGAGGMIARLSVTCYSTAAMTGRFLSTSEYASVLLLMDTTTLTATFQASSGSSSTVVVAETTSIAALGVEDKCDSACKGMIAMAAVVTALAVFAAVIAIIAICCPCGIIKSPRDVYARQLREKYGIQTEVAEAIDVYGDDDAAENARSHEPTSMAPSPREATEPMVK